MLCADIVFAYICAENALAFGVAVSNNKPLKIRIDDFICSLFLFAYYYSIKIILLKMIIGGRGFGFLFFYCMLTFF